MKERIGVEPLPPPPSAHASVAPRAMQEENVKRSILLLKVKYIYF